MLLVKIKNGLKGKIMSIKNKFPSLIVLINKENEAYGFCDNHEGNCLKLFDPNYFPFTHQEVGLSKKQLETTLNKKEYGVICLVLNNIQEFKTLHGLTKPVRGSRAPSINEKNDLSLECVKCVMDYIMPKIFSSEYEYWDNYWRSHDWGLKEFFLLTKIIY